MRKFLVFGSISLGFAFSVSAQQHAAAAPSFTAPVAAPHAAPAPAPTHAAAPTHPTHTSPNGTKAASTSVANHTKPLPKPSPIIVPPVSSITTTTAGPCKHVGAAFGPYNACPGPVAGGGALYGGGAYYIPIPYYFGGDAPAEELPPGPQAVEQLAANDQAIGRPDEVAEDETPTSRPSGMGYGEINKALAEFVFVNRDGTKFNAVAYSFVSDKLQYVTKEGVRHTATLDSLDLDATQKVNEELGNTINLPGLPPSGVALNVSVPGF
jgi:hypothetical protein